MGRCPGTWLAFWLAFALATVLGVGSAVWFAVGPDALPRALVHPVTSSTRGEGSPHPLHLQQQNLPPQSSLSQSQPHQQRDEQLPQQKDKQQLLVDLIEQVRQQNQQRQQFAREQQGGSQTVQGQLPSALQQQGAEQQQQQQQGASHAPPAQPQGQQQPLLQDRQAMNGQGSSELPSQLPTLPQVGSLQAGYPESHIPSLRYMGHVTSDPYVPGGWFGLHTVIDGAANYTFPPPEDKYRADNRKCVDIAAETREPYTSYWKPRNASAGPLFGSIPRAFFQWEGNISLAEFQATPSHLRGSSCVHCSHVTRYKVLNGNLYRNTPGADWAAKPIEDMMLMALHLFKVPDTDLLVHYGDGCPPAERPVLSWCICRDKGPKAGFTLPSYSSWSSALGPTQLGVLHSCLSTRYPPRGPRGAHVLWRGSTTDTRLTSFNSRNYKEATRVRLHEMTQGHPAFDAGLVTVFNADMAVKNAVTNRKPKLEFEDFNKAAVILDVDGNGWSDRFVKMTHFNTPILKQASNLTAFFEHLVAPGFMIESFANDLSDVLVKGDALVREWRADPTRLVAEAQHLQGFSLAMLNTVAIAEAMAYSMTVYASKITWKAGTAPGFWPVPWTHACTDNTRSPVEVCQEMRKRTAPSMEQLLLEYGILKGPV